MSPGVYIHIPYCSRKCVYCSFNSVGAAGGVPAAYVEALIRDLEASAPGWDRAEFGSVYLGGGTPSLLEPEALDRVLRQARSRLALAADVEITLEANPSSIDLPKLEAYRDIGVNRLSVGLQSLDQRDLRFLGRLHSPGRAVRALDEARAAGFGNISADIMIGIPGQCARGVEATLAEIAPRVTHVSCYLLSVEAGTPLRAMVDRGEVGEVADEEAVGLLEKVALALDREGMGRYEISNWARRGFECRHNQVYWRRGEYLGLGAGASSFRGGMRSRRLARPDEYVNAVLGGSDPVSFRETLGADAACGEEIMLGLRTAAGLDLERLAEEYGCDLTAMGFLLESLVEDGLIARKGKTLQLTPKGMLVSDEVICNISASLYAS